MSDAQARVTAMSWHGGQSSALYAFGSCGAVPEDAHDLLHEIAMARGEAHGRSRLALEELATYVNQVGARGPQPGWASLWDDHFEHALS